MKVRALTIDARVVFNLTSPRYLPRLAKRWAGKREWWNQHYEPVRDLCERRYIELFNAQTGHYQHLEESIRKEGFRNPVMLTAGRLLRRSVLELPPPVRRRGNYVACEYVGGSRLLIAAKLGLHVPAIVNDYYGVLKGQGEIIETRDSQALLTHFADKPRTIRWDMDGSVYVNHLPYAHYPEEARITFGQQRSIRRAILAQVYEEVSTWMAEHDQE